MGNLDRLVIHCTATPGGREVTAAEIRKWHCAPPPTGRGWRQVGYTDLIHLDGSIERLVPADEDTFISPKEATNGAVGWNSTSRHVAYAGGVAADGRTPKDTRTPAQKASLERYVRDFLQAHPDCDVVGHNQLAPKACPSFDVPEWLLKTTLKK